MSKIAFTHLNGNHGVIYTRSGANKPIEYYCRLINILIFENIISRDRLVTKLVKCSKITDINSDFLIQNGVEFLFVTYVGDMIYSYYGLEDENWIRRHLRTNVFCDYHIRYYNRLAEEGEYSKYEFTVSIPLEGDFAIGYKALADDLLNLYNCIIGSYCQ